MRVTLSEVAKKAGVSVATAAKVISGNKGNIRVSAFHSGNKPRFRAVRIRRTVAVIGKKFYRSFGNSIRKNMCMKIYKHNILF